jgi:hypothetical protein
MREVMGVVLTNMDYRIIFICQQGFLKFEGFISVSGRYEKALGLLKWIAQSGRL